MYTVQLRAPTLRCVLRLLLMKWIQISYVKDEDGEALIETSDCVYLVVPPPPPDAHFSVVQRKLATPRASVLMIQSGTSTIQSRVKFGISPHR